MNEVKEDIGSGFSKRFSILLNETQKVTPSCFFNLFWQVYGLYQYNKADWYKTRQNMTAVLWDAELDKHIPDSNFNWARLAEF
jgi:hypothetical protein